MNDTTNRLLLFRFPALAAAMRTRASVPSATPPSTATGAKCSQRPIPPRSTSTTRGDPPMISTWATSGSRSSSARSSAASCRSAMVIPQFEDAALLDHFEEMISQPGVDAVVVGPRDLSLNMGFLDGPNHPEVQEMIDNVVAICKRTGVAAGITAGSREDSAKQVNRGMTMILAIAQIVVQAGSKEFLPE